MSNCNMTQIHNHLVCKLALNYLAKLAIVAKWFGVRS